MKRLKIAYRNLRLKNKIWVTYLSVILLSMLCLFFLIYQMFTWYLEKESLYSAERSLQQTQQYTVQKLYHATRLLATVRSDLGIEPFTEEYSDLEMVDQYRCVIALQKYFTNIKQNNELSHVSVYFPSKFLFTDEEEFKKFEDLQQDPWYETILQNRNRIVCTAEEEDGHRYITVGRLVSDEYDYGRYVGAIKLYLDENVFGEIVRNCVTTKSGLCYIVNSCEEIMTASDSRADNCRIGISNLQEAVKTGEWASVELNGHPAFLQARALDYSDWTMVYVIPKESLHIGSGLMLAMVGFLLLILLVSYLMALVISRTIIGRVERLNRQMEKSRDGVFEAIEDHIPAGSRDEIDALSESYNRLVHRIDQYALMQVRHEKAIRSAELKALQEQVNPHFLYNVLDLIGWMAMKHEDDKVVQLVHSLAEFYKIGLHKGTETLTVAQEIEHLRLYIGIQQKRYDNLEDIEFDIPEELLSCVIQKSLFLPLVENSVNHGIRSGEKPGRIVISACSEGEDICFCIRDNGSGIPPEVLDSLRAGTYQGRGAKGFGIRNLTERIQTYYGPKYGIRFGDCSEGAEVFLRVPRVEQTP